MSETLEAPATRPETALTSEVFEYHMTAMAAHYTAKRNGKPPTVYPLPTNLLHPVTSEGMMLTGSNVGAAALIAAKQKCRVQTQDFANLQQMAVQAATNKLQADHNTSAFDQAMDAQEAKAKQQADDTIHAQFGSLKALGHQHPEQQAAILSLTQSIGAFFTNLLEGVVNFFRGLVKQIMAWINAAVEWVKGAADTVAHWAASTASAIGHFFGL